MSDTEHEHEWVEITTQADPRQRFVCTRCGARAVEAREPDPGGRTREQTWRMDP